MILGIMTHGTTIHGTMIHGITTIMVHHTTTHTMVQPIITPITVQNPDIITMVPRIQDLSTRPAMVNQIEDQMIEIMAGMTNQVSQVQHTNLAHLINQAIAVQIRASGDQQQLQAVIRQLPQEQHNVHL